MSVRFHAQGDRMPVKLAVENREELRFVVYHYSGHIDPADVLASVKLAVSHFAPDQFYRELLIFKRDTDLSDFNRESLTMLLRKSDDLYRQLKLGPRAGAAVH